MPWRVTDCGRLRMLQSITAVGFLNSDLLPGALPIGSSTTSLRRWRSTRDNRLLGAQLASRRSHLRTEALRQAVRREGGATKIRY